MVNDGKLLEEFVAWKGKYQKSLLAALLSEDCDSSDDTLAMAYSQELRAKISSFLEELLVERWAYWRTMGAPARKANDTLYHFRQKMILGKAPTLTDAEEMKPVQEAPLRAFAQRLWVAGSKLSGPCFHPQPPSLVTI